MKNTIITTLALAFALATISFINSPSAEDHGGGGSGIHWTGKKVTGQHTGTLEFSDIDMEYDGKGQLTSARFVVDMTTMACTDLKGEKADDLIGHLMGDDFFGVKDHPTSTFESTEIETNGQGQYEISGTMTIKGVSETISFPAEIVEHHGKMNAAARVEIDRTKYGIQYGSGSFFEGLGDRMINDEFILDIHIETEKN